MTDSYLDSEEERIFAICMVGVGIIFYGSFIMMILVKIILCILGR